ncbi:hypothetical protein J8I26_14360 [Herbaspirillum sp. LeCh32-8]|uniref:hypothetical protein n=1 Tax=Herbaspirillum sp. LeCh32-8 TaxID=2821356 RepID=UPI001AE5D639|nr:hypothetical protein [Herbaspirillum sp. LeCh32-8]MBP0599298.1 hypothetical protein [Herbaspirillum sp. LeCh32-8]
MILKSCRFLFPLFTSLFILPAAAPANAALYKCLQDGAVAYADQPCADTPEFKPAPLPTVPALRSAAPADKPAQGRKPIPPKPPAGIDRNRQKTCSKLALHRRWAEQDVSEARAKPLRAQDKTLENAQRKARRAEELYRQECAGGPDLP